MRSWSIWILGFFGLLCCATALAGASASKPVDIRDLMNVTQFDQTGLNKLSADEIKALNAWLNQYLDARTTTANVPLIPQAAVAPLPAAASGVASFGSETMTDNGSTEGPNLIETRIAGPFTGWAGDTIFKLENGQVWQQAATGYYTNVALDHPKVVIKKLTFGYLLTLPGHGETVFVRRIK